MLIFLFIIFFVLLAWRRLDWAVMLLIAALPSYLIRFKIFGLPATLLEIMIVSAFLIWLVPRAKAITARVKLRFKQDKNASKRKIIDYPFGWELIILLIISLAAAVASGFSSNALGIWKAYFFEPALLYILVFNVFKQNDKVPLSARGNRARQYSFDFEKIIWPLVAVALGVSLFAVYQHFTGAFIPNEFWAAAATRRVTSFFGYPNAVGLFLGPLVLLFIGYILFLVKKEDWRANRYKLGVIAIVIIFSLLSIIFAHSKGALAGIGAGLFIFGLAADKRIRWSLILFMPILAATILFYNPLKQSVFDIVTINDFSGQIRKQQWQETRKMLSDGRWLFGAGLANYQKTVAPYHQAGIFIVNHDPEWLHNVLYDARYRKRAWQPLEIYLYPHNIFLNFWSELGLAGLLLFIWLIGKYFFIGYKLIRKSVISYKLLVIGLISAMIAIIVHGLVDVPYFKNDLAAMFWLLFAIMGMIDLVFLRGDAKPDAK